MESEVFYNTRFHIRLSRMLDNLILGSLRERVKLSCFKEFSESYCTLSRFLVHIIFALIARTLSTICLNFPSVLQQSSFEDFHTKKILWASSNHPVMEPP